MKLRSLSLTVAVLWLASVILAFSDPDPLEVKIAKALQTYQTVYPQEKVYLQTDKQYYVGGETIWFKGYVTKDHLASTISTVFYADLLDKDNHVVQHMKVPAVKGAAWGDFPLADGFPPGDYRIRAYTAWMLNFDPGFLAYKDVHVYAPGAAAEEGQGGAAPADGDSGGQNAGAQAFSVQFFPEGGDLIETVESVVAFKAIGANGLPVEVTGTITDGQGTVVDSIRSVHDGMGTFNLKPASGMQYTASVQTADGRSQSFALPAAKKEGATIHIINMNNGKLFFQAKRGDMNADTYDKLRLVAQTQGHLVYYAPVDFSHGYIGGVITVDKAPSGIMQITLFTEDGRPLAERLVFIRNQLDLLPLTLEQQQVSLSPRGLNSFLLALPDTIQGSYSVAVTDADQVDAGADQENILSGLWLTSDIKGNVYHPGWYFATVDSATNAGLDLVMLTNGWRRFAWEKILDGKYPDIRYDAEMTGLSITGRAMNRNKPLNNGKVSLIFKATRDTLTIISSGVSNKEGYFRSENLHFHDSATLYYKATDSSHKGRLVDLSFLPPLNEDSVPVLPVPIRSTPAPAAGLDNYLTLAQERNQVQTMINNRMVQLKEVSITADKVSKEKKLNDAYAHGAFKSSDGRILDLTGQPLPFINVFQYLQGKIAGLLIEGDITSPTITWRGDTPGLYLNEFPSTTMDIANLMIDDIAMVKVFPPPFMGALGGAGGGIAIYTKTGSATSSNIRGYESTRVMGFSVVRQFYSPDYSVKQDIHDLPDKRATLYWNPDLQPDSTGQRLIRFYNTDITKRYRIVLEGIDQYGRVGHIEKVVGGAQ